MTVMNFDLEDGLPKVSFTLKPDDAERFAAFLAECEQAKADAHRLRALVAGVRDSFNRECDDADAILRTLGFEPKNCRTEGGSLILRELLGAIEHRDVMTRRAARKAEREWCAALCDGLAKVMTPDRRSVAEDLARAIREVAAFPDIEVVPVYATPKPAKGLTVQADADGVWLAFAASTGLHALLNVERIADSHGGIVSKALRDWAADVSGAAR